MPSLLQHRLLGAKSLLVRALDRPNARGVLCLFGSVYITLTRRCWCRIRWTSVGWVHEYRDGVLVRHQIGGPTPQDLDEIVANYFFHTYTPAPGDVVVDIGAGEGEDVFVCRRLVGPTGQIIAVEAHPATYARLKECVKRNGWQNVSVMNLAVVDAPGTLRLSDTENHLTNRLSTGDKGVSVEATTLEEVLRKSRVETATFLKMNIEGAERLALANVSPSSLPAEHLAICCHDFLAERGEGEELRTSAVVEELLTRAGYALAARRHVVEPWIADTVYSARTSESRPAG